VRVLADASGGLLFADHPAIFELDDAVTESGVSFGVRDLNDGGAALIQALEELHDFFALGRVQVARGLIGQNKFWILDDCASDAHELLLTAGKLVREEIFFADDVEAVEDVADQADA